MEKPTPTAAGVLGALPWRDRLRIKSNALWSLCPVGLRGALVWTALSPMIWAAIALLTRLDPVGRYPMRWGSWQMWVMFWLPSVVLSVVFLPAARGILALRRGGLWPEYSAALKGVDQASGEQSDPVFADWALFSWMWVLSVFVSWLDERALREAGATFGHSVSWHALNVARLEICLLIFATAVAGWLSKSGVFQKVEKDGPQTTGEGQKGADWSKLGSAVRGNARSIGQWWRDLVAEEKGRWEVAKKSSPSKWMAWRAWFGSGGYVMRAASMSTAATFAWWQTSAGMANVFDEGWQTMTIGVMSFWKFFAIAALCALLTRVVSRRSLGEVGSALWFGPAGPTAVAWARMAVVAVAADRGWIFAMSRAGFCVEPRLAGGGILLVVMAWVGLVFVGEALGWAGSFFASWNERARALGALGLETYARVAGQALADSWRAAGTAKAQLGRAVEQKAMQNEAGLAQVLRKELEEAVPAAPKRGGGSKRL